MLHKIGNKKLDQFEVNQVLWNNMIIQKQMCTDHQTKVQGALDKYLQCHNTCICNKMDVSYIEVYKNTPKMEEKHNLQNSTSIIFHE